MFATDSSVPIATSPESLNPSVSGFQPSKALCDNRKGQIPQTINLLRLVGITTSVHYQGDVNMVNILLPKKENCSLFLGRLPARATPADIFNDISEGGIFHCSIAAALPGKHSTAAAHLAFKTRAAAEDFYTRADDPSRGFYVLGHRIKVTWNRNKLSGLEDSQMYQSRVVRIWGPSAYVNSHEIEALLHNFIKFELVDRREWFAHGGEIRVVELSFPSIFGQSRAAMKLLCEKQHAGMLHRLLSFAYAPDKCDPTS